MRLALAVAAAASLCACSYVSFERPKSADELRLEGSIRGFYSDLRRAFAAGNADALAALYAPSITHPMTQEQVREWGRKFFGEHGRARLRLSKVDIEELAFQRAVVSVSYAVETPDGKGGFSGVERDLLARRPDGGWAIASWDKQ